MGVALAQDSEEYLGMIQAVATGDETVLDGYLKSGFDVNQKIEELTLLHIAALSGQILYLISLRS